MNYVTMFLVEHVSSRTQESSRFFEQGKVNLFSRHILTIKRNIKNLRMSLVILLGYSKETYAQNK